MTVEGLSRGQFRKEVLEGGLKWVWHELIVREVKLRS